MMEKSNVKLVPFIQSVIGMFTGTYKIPKEHVKVDYDHGVVLESLDKVGYHSLAYSLAKMTILPLMLIILAITIFQRKDVH